TAVPSGITEVSTAITLAFGLAFKSTPVDVTPEQPSHFAVYAVADTVIVFPSGVLLESSDFEASLDFTECFSFPSAFPCLDDVTCFASLSVSFETWTPFISNSCPITIRLESNSFHFLISDTDTSNSLASLLSVSPLSTIYMVLMTNFCFGCIVVVSNSFISTNSLTVVLYSSAMSQRLSPFSTSYVSADTVVRLAPAIMTPVAKAATNFFIGSPSLISNIAYRTTGIGAMQLQLV